MPGRPDEAAATAAPITTCRREGWRRRIVIGRLQFSSRAPDRDPLRAGPPYRAVPALAARAGSYHQMVGNAGAAYCGMLSGRPNRFQRAVRVTPDAHCGTT